VERNKNLHVRLTEQEKAQLAQLTADYRLSAASDLVRLMIDFVDANRPRLIKQLDSVKKASALSLN